MKNSDDLTYWLLANSLWWISWPVWQSALTCFGDWRTLFQSSKQELQRVGFTRQQAERIRQHQTEWCADVVWKWLAEKPHRAVVSLQDERYPSQLKEIYDPPLVLYVEGDVTLLSRKQIAVVGARHASLQGKHNAAWLSSELAKQGLVVTSGLAAGIDQAAHRAALAVGGQTIGVSGTGLLRYYPAQHRGLIQQLASGQHGAVISEYDLTLGARKEHFPRRNRIIAALSLGVLVIEAACRSGSLITAHLANEYGREVFAVPGTVQHDLSRGCHALIKQGARLVESVEDVLTQLHLTIKKNNTPTPVACFPSEWCPAEKQLYGLLSKTIAVSLERLVVKSGLTVAQVSSILMELELAGWVEMSSGGFIQTASFKL